MSQLRSVACFFAAIGFYTVSAVCAAQPPTQPQSVVNQIDHILIASSDAKELFSLLSDTFQFPVAWPMADYGNFASGGVSVGNVNLEIIKDSAPVAGAAKSRWTGFALEPAPLQTSLPELDARGIRHGTPAPFKSRQPDGSFATRWTTVALPDVSNDSVEVFFCEYGHDVPARRRRLLEQLQSREGGPLTVQSVGAIVVGAKDTKFPRERWQKLLTPIQESSPGVWRVGAGPAIRVIQAEKDGIEGLVINVKSLKQARRCLKAHDLLGKDHPDSLTLAGPLLNGLNIRLVEQPTKGL